MSIRRRWTANCDEPGCGVVRLLEGDQYDGRWALGEQISDDGWAAAPSVQQTYCPQHARAARSVCPTEGCDGDGRYSAPGRGHLASCTYPISPPGEIGGPQ